jgi:hypothetical protein
LFQDPVKLSILYFERWMLKQVQHDKFATGVKMKKLVLFILFLFSSSPAFALDLGIPIACSYGEDCIIDGYFDHEAKEGAAADYTCGKLSSDNQVSTNFKLMNYPQMKAGVNVVAGDAGIVKQLRDGMSDVNVNLVGQEAIRGRECGNGVVIEHKRGYETEYCHLKQGSIAVKKGDKVEKGQMIGQVGLSGLASFPNLGFTVRLNGKAVDPFTGDIGISATGDPTCGSLDTHSLWDKLTEKKMKYISTALLSMGFADRVPHEQGAREGKFSSVKIKDSARLLSLWADVFGVMKGDVMTMTMIAPDGSILISEPRKFTANRVQIFQFLGKKPLEKLWEKGTYTGKIELTRKDSGEAEQLISASVNVDIVSEQEFIESSRAEMAKKKAEAENKGGSEESE